MPDKTPEQSGRPWGRFIVGCIVFGLLMSIREEFDFIWLRVAVAGCAFVALGVSLSFFRKTRP